jgi:hypothetical protein
VSVMVSLCRVSKSSVLVGYLDSLSYSLGESISVCLESIACKDNTVANVPDFRGVSCVDAVGSIREASVSGHDHEIIPCNGYLSEDQLVRDINLG